MEGTIQNNVTCQLRACLVCAIVHVPAYWPACQMRANPLA